MWRGLLGSENGLLHYDIFNGFKLAAYLSLNHVHLSQAKA